MLLEAGVLGQASAHLAVAGSHHALHRTRHVQQALGAFAIIVDRPRPFPLRVDGSHDEIFHSKALSFSHEPVAQHQSNLYHASIGRDANCW